MTGVSPAYFLSRSGPGFGPDDLVSGLPFLAGTGYETFQAEVFLESSLPLWTEESTKAVADAAKANGLQCNAFVAHFLGSVFSSGSTLSQGLPLDQAKTAVGIAASVTSSAVANGGNKPGNKGAGIGSDGRIFVVPVPALALPKASMMTPEASEAWKHSKTESASRFRDIIGTLLRLCGNAGLQLALELLPGNVLGGSAAFMSLVAEPGFEDLGLLLDTGHFWAMGEPVQDLPRTLGSHIVATHLCDNDGIVNLSLCPGDGTISFVPAIRALGDAGYIGSLDLEIVCPRDTVETEYRRAFSQFKHITDQAFALPDHITQPGHIAQPGRTQANGQQPSKQFYKETI